MIWNRLFIALGAMTFSYALSEISLAIVSKMEHCKRLKFVVYIFSAIYYFTCIGSLFVGFYIHYLKINSEDLQKAIRGLSREKDSANEKINSLLLENEDLKQQLRQESFRTEKRSYESGHTQGYVNGYSVGFEDCMDILSLDHDQKTYLLPMARRSGIHRLKTRPSFLVEQPAIDENGILK